MSRERALAAFHLDPTDRVPCFETVQHPEFERALTGIGPYAHPQQARLAMLDALDIDLFSGGVPATDDPIENPFADGQSSRVTDDGHRQVRWGATATSHWDWGQEFTCPEQVFDYDPEQDMPGETVDELARRFQENLDRQRALVGDRFLVTAGTYKTLFMWPLMTFGWEQFLVAAKMDPVRFKEILDGFARVSEKTFEALSLTDVEVVTSHDDICMTRGAVCSPEWLEEMIYPHYRRFWDIVRSTGKKVLFISDGCVNPVADAVFDCGADGIFAEPHTDLVPIIEKYGRSKVIIGNVDTRTISYQDRDAIEAEVRRCVAMGRDTPGYFMGVTNEITYNAPVANVAAYFELRDRYCRR